MMPTSQVLAETANIIKILEALILAFGAFQIWVTRGERRDGEQRASLLARKAANYQAWQVVNSAHGKGGSGGRIDALQDLVVNNVSLAGVQLDGAWLEGVSLPRAVLRRGSLRQATLLGADLTGANLEAADLSGAVLEGARLRDAYLRKANLAGASLGTVDLRGANLQDIRGWRDIASISYANIQGVRNAPPGFLEWARENGAVEGEAVASQTVNHAIGQGFSAEFRQV